MKALVTSLLLAASIGAHAEVIPLDEKGFVDAVPKLSPQKVVEMLGEPAESITVKDDRSGEVIGVIWQYAYLNTNEEGDYYTATELDWIDDKVVNIVFSNADGETEAHSAITECAPVC
jgi:hypothetical protein